MRLAPGVVAWAALVLLSGCDDGGPVAPDGGTAAWVHARFEPTADPIDFGAVPWPDDLYLEEGRIAVGALPSEAQAIPGAYPAALRHGLADLDGFSTTAPIFFYFPPRSLDPTSLPDSPASSLREDSSVFLLDADPASPAAFTRVPVNVHWHSGLGQLAMRPYDGHPLTPGRRYAAVVTSTVRDQAGMPIGPDPRFAEIRDATTRPDDPVKAEAYARYTPVLASLASSGTPRTSVAALAVFTVQSVTPDLRDARNLVWEGDVPVASVQTVVPAGHPLDDLLGIPAADQAGLDVEGGVRHRRIGWLIQGWFYSPWLASDRVGVHGRFQRDAGGRLLRGGRDRVPFTLTLPAAGLERVPLVLFQHGIGSERSAMLAVADVLAASGVAVLAIDMPFHGLRASLEVSDARHNYGTGEGPDGFGDIVGERIYLDFMGVADERGDLIASHPAYARDVIRQSAVDLMTAVRLVREGDWGAVRRVEELESLSFASDPLGFASESLGGVVGAVFLASEPEVGAAALVVTGGDLTRLVERSPTFSEMLWPVLLPKVGLDPEQLDPTGYPASFHPELAIVQTLLDRGDAIAFAPVLARQPKHILLQMAEHDELVPNMATEALARASGAPLIAADPVHTDLSRVEAPVSGNLELPSGRVTRGLYRFAPATHVLLSRRAGRQSFAHPPEPPFETIAPRTVTNPLDQALSQLVYFFESWRSGVAEITAPPP